MMAPQWLIGAIIIAAVARNPKEKLRNSIMQILTAMAKIEITDGQLSLSLSEATWVVHILIIIQSTGRIFHGLLAF